MHRRLLYKWRDQLEPIEDGEGPPANSRERELRQQVTQLKRLVADKTGVVVNTRCSTEARDVRREFCVSSLSSAVSAH